MKIKDWLGEEVGGSSKAQHSNNELLFLQSAF